jgi:hypothetical protein
MEYETEQKTDTEIRATKHRRPLRKIILSVVAVFVLIVLIAGGYVGYLYTISPAAIRNPRLEHAHIRLQVLVNGTPVNFGEAKYQTSLAEATTCSIAVPPQPIHLHDNKDQFVHLHWKDMTGGLVLKYYGWNLIGGPSNTLGYRFDELPKLVSVPIHGDVLPAYPKDAKLWVYSGDENSYKERSAQDFLHQDFETFFGVKSTVNSEPNSSTASTTTNSAPETHEEQLKRINNLLGNVVVLAQKDKPSNQQVKDRFAKLDPLPESICGG